MPFLYHTSHISSTQQPFVVSGYHNGQWGYSTFPPSQKVLLGSPALKSMDMLESDVNIFSEQN